jgi:hypothetical protein
VRRWALAAILVGACHGKDAPPAGARPSPIPEPEHQRGAEACKEFITRACACAKAHPERADVADKCANNSALPEAMDLALDVDRDPGSAPEDVFRAQSEVRQVIATCMEGVNWLATSRCP